MVVFIRTRKLLFCQELKAEECLATMVSYEALSYSSSTSRELLLFCLLLMA